MNLGVSVKCWPRDFCAKLHYETVIHTLLCISWERHIQLLSAGYILTYPSRVPKPASYIHKHVKFYQWGPPSFNAQDESSTLQLSNDVSIVFFNLWGQHLNLKPKCVMVNRKYAPTLECYFSETTCSIRPSGTALESPCPELSNGTSRMTIRQLGQHLPGPKVWAGVMTLGNFLSIGRGR